MTSRWLLFAILVATVEDTAEMVRVQTQVSDVVAVETSSAPDDRRETVTDTARFTAETSLDTTTEGDKKTSAVQELRDRHVRQTDELNKAMAALTIAQQLEQRLTTLEREKYEYMKTIQDKVLCLVDNARFPRRGSSDDMSSVIVQRPTCRTSEQSGRRLQMIRRLMAGAELGLVQLQSIRQLNASNTDRRKK